MVGGYLFFLFSWIVPMRPEKHRAFSLVEAIFVVLFIGILAAVAVPRFNFALVSKHKAETTAQKIVIDLRRARSLAISDAVNNNKGFELKMIGSSPYTGYELENRDTKVTIDSHTIDSDVTCTSDKKNFEFLPLGNLKGGGGTWITLSAQGKSFTITITLATGAIKCTEN